MIPSPRVVLAALGLFPQVAAAPAAPAAPYRLGGPVRRLSGGKGGVKGAPFDLQGRLGKGKAVGLVFWAPGFTDSERAVVSLSAWLKSAAPQIEVYAVTGRRDDQKDEELWERWSMLPVPKDLPLLVDDKFTVSTALATSDVPNLALFDRAGQLVVAKIKDPSQLLVTAQGNAPAEEIVRKVAAGTAVAQIKQMHPYYPSADLVGRCAPAFTARKFNSTENYTFDGRSPSGRPTLVMFWSSTCKHCQKEIPQLVPWIKAHPGAFDVVSITAIKKDKPGGPSHRAVTEAYIRAQGIPWVVLEDPDFALGQLYRNVSTPTTYVVSPSGTIVDVWYYAHEEGFDRVMNAALAKARTATAACSAVPAPPAPTLAFTAAGPDGKRAAISSLVDRPALVHFWATWCKPCVAELPALLRFRDKLEKDKAGKVVFVSVEEADAGPRIAAFQKSLGADLRSYRAPSGGVADEVDLAYRVPRTYVVSAKGEVLASYQGEQPWDDPAFAERVRSRLSVLGGGR